MKSEKDGINPAVEPGGQVASNAWPWADGGCIFADAPHAVTSAAATVHQISMHRNIRRDGAPDNHELRAGRALVLRLSY